MGVPPHRYVFLSYSREDLVVASEVSRRLDRAGVPVWMDRTGVTVGRPFASDIEAAIDGSGCLLVLMSSASSRSEWVRREIERALQRSIPIMPALLDGTRVESAFPQLKDLERVNLANPAERDQEIGRLIRGIREHVPQVHRDEQEIVQDLQVPDMVAEYLFLGNRALRRDELRGKYLAEPPQLLATLEPVRQQWLAQQIGKAQDLGQTIDNNLSYSLHRLSVTREQDATGHRHNVYTLAIRPTDFFHFLFPNLALDEPIEIDGRATTARSELGMAHDRLRIDNIENFQCHFRIGTGSVLISSDNQVVVPVRSNRQLIVGGHLFHLSTAEGMLRPIDVHDGEPSPFATCIRALGDELGIRAGEHYQPDDDMRCLAVGMDTERAQPYVVFIVRTANTSFDAIRRQWLLEAEDRHENSDIQGLPWTPDVARALAAGRLPYQSAAVVGASNHVRFGYTLAALHDFGTDAVG